ncbi:MAG: hypothetical protein NC412_00525 [Roseburia sp.]|nr:hypothetical protein [Roseburia sp.]MCM1278602.1 hypothetical protein [Robinsoniella sp.]
MKETEEKRDFFKTGKIEDYLTYKNNAKDNETLKTEAMVREAERHSIEKYW